MTKQFKIIVEKHADGYVAYPLGIKGVVIGQGETYDEALADVKSAILFHIETFGAEMYQSESPIKGSTLRTILTQAGIPRDEFLEAYDNA
jgi:predicted RNase H-like HicB family nuclease